MVLDRCEVRGKEQKWFRDYLRGRTQITKINDTLSKPMINDIGVPQGSILSSTLFSLYINDISKVINYCDINLFADDAMIRATAKTLREAIEKINCHLINLTKWLCQKKLKLNIKKTKFMILNGGRYNTEGVTIQIMDEPIERVVEIKYLGIVIDNKLNIKRNNDELCKKSSKKKQASSQE